MGFPCNASLKWRCYSIISWPEGWPRSVEGWRTQYLSRNIFTSQTGIVKVKPATDTVRIERIRRIKYAVLINKNYTAQWQLFASFYFSPLFQKMLLFFLVFCFWIHDHTAFHLDEKNWNRKKYAVCKCLTETIVIPFKPQFRKLLDMLEIKYNQGWILEFNISIYELNSK